MKKYKNKAKDIIPKIFFIFLSLFLHFILFLINYEKKSISFGKELIPIDIFEIEKLSSLGNYSEKLENESVKAINRNNYEEEFIKTKDTNNLLTEKNTKNILKLSNNVENKKIKNSRTSDLKKYIGNEGNINKNKIEKGSLIGEGLEKISCLSSCRPKYPKVALRRGFQGLLILKLLIARSGEVIDVKVIKSTGYKILDQAGIESAKNSKYLPLKKERTITTKDSFVLNN